MNKEERQELSDMNQSLNKQFADIFGKIFPSYSHVGGLDYDDGTPVQFDIGQGKHLYRYYAHPTAGRPGKIPRAGTGHSIMCLVRMATCSWSKMASNSVRGKWPSNEQQIVSIRTIVNRRRLTLALVDQG